MNSSRCSGSGYCVLHASRGAKRFQVTLRQRPPPGTITNQTHAHVAGDVHPRACPIGALHFSWDLRSTWFASLWASAGHEGRGRAAGKALLLVGVGAVGVFLWLDIFAIKRHKKSPLYLIADGTRACYAKDRKNTTTHWVRSRWWALRPTISTTSPPCNLHLPRRRSLCRCRTRRRRTLPRGIAGTRCSPQPQIPPCWAACCRSWARRSTRFGIVLTRAAPSS